MSDALKKVRFIHNFIMTVTQTVLDGEGKLTVQENDFHIEIGDSYSLTQYEEHEDGRVDLYFPDSSPLSGVARNVEGDYCELRNPAVPNTTVNLARGCGGCNT
jgi:hypothetical protein